MTEIFVPCCIRFRSVVFTSLGPSLTFDLTVFTKNENFSRNKTFAQLYIDFVCVLRVRQEDEWQLLSGTDSFSVVLTVSQRYWQSLSGTDSRSVVLTVAQRYWQSPSGTLSRPALLSVAQRYRQSLSGTGSRSAVLTVAERYSL